MITKQPNGIFCANLTQPNDARLIVGYGKTADEALENAILKDEEATRRAQWVRHDDTTSAFQRTIGAIGIKYRDAPAQKAAALSALRLVAADMAATARKRNDGFNIGLFMRDSGFCID